MTIRMGTINSKQSSEKYYCVFQHLCSDNKLSILRTNDFNCKTREDVENLANFNLYI